ncbi:MAG: cobalamin-dependent protein [Spirochaetota bacterium]
MKKNDNNIHPLGTRARILLSSVFGPYARDDEYGSRAINPMELYHNQVTRVQGPFSLRMFHRSFGLMLIQENVDAPCTLLDFPTLERFAEEIKTKAYDIIGISSIIPNVGKVKKMCEIIRKHAADVKIVVGGHIANLPDLHKIIDADFIVKGEGISWFRKYLGQDTKAPVKHPAVISGFGNRIFGIRLPGKDTAATLIPSVGCPMGCNFCSTSHLFGGKGKSVNFYETGDELFNVILQIESKLNVQRFFIMDENFLLYKQRALRLLELIEKHKKSWSFYIFSSAKVISSYSDEQLLGLGVSWIWMGLEGKGSQYTKLKEIDTRSLVKHLQSIGIGVLGSSIIGLENHTPENIESVIDYAVSHGTDFHQFMLYTPIPGTALYEEHKKKKTLLPEKECPLPDTHGQYRFNFKHKYIKNKQEIQYLLQAFQKDFETNGPSIARLIRTLLNAWKQHKDHADMRVRSRILWETRRLRDVYPGAVWAMRKYYKKNKYMYDKLSEILRDIYKEFGIIVRIIAPAVGMWVYFKIAKEAHRLSCGWTYEPETHYEKNEKALAMEGQ